MTLPRKQQLSHKEVTTGHLPSIPLSSILFPKIILQGLPLQEEHHTSLSSAESVSSLYLSPLY